jgi:Na+/melibiose symporter-like transporter
MLTLFISVLIATLGAGALDALLVFFFQTNLHAPDGLPGLLPMAVGAGSVLGAISVLLVVKRPGSARIFWLTLYLLGVLLILFARQDSLWPALVFLFLTGLPPGAINTVVGPLLMHMIPHDMMGRVVSVFPTCQTLQSDLGFPGWPAWVRCLWVYVLTCWACPLGHTIRYIW